MECVFDVLETLWEKEEMMTTNIFSFSDTLGNNR